MTAPEALDPERAKDDQRKEWRAAADGWRRWDTHVVAWTAPTTIALIAEAKPAPGMRVLDIGSGTGEPALPLAQAVTPTGHVTATDLSPEMLAVAEAKAKSRQLSNMSFEVADAEELPYADATFDLVTGRFSIMFCPDPIKALREIRRVLKPGGRAAFSVWAAADKNRYFTTIMAPFGKRGLLPASVPGTPSPFRFAQPGSLAAALESAGFEGVNEETQEMILPWPGPVEEWLGSMSDLSPTFRGLLATVPSDQAEHLLGEIRAAAENLADEHSINFPSTAHIGSGLKPTSK